MAEQDFVDLTPKGGMREVKLTAEDLRIIKENPRGLTKEGVAVQYWLWAQSSNQHLQLRYLAMYKICERFTKSQTFDDGAILLARKSETTKQGITKEHIWKDKIGLNPKTGVVNVATDVEKLFSFVNDKLSTLKFIVTKG
jgi:hypothetical protein